MNLSGKVDRASLTRFFKKNSHPLEGLLPHRVPMLWIDEVLESGPEGGRARVVLNPRSHAFTDGKLRRTSVVEWLAQAYGVVVAKHRQQQGEQEAPEQALLAAVKQVKWDPSFPGEGALEIHVRCAGKMGPLSLVRDLSSIARASKLPVVRSRCLQGRAISILRNG